MFLELRGAYLKDRLCWLRGTYLEVKLLWEVEGNYLEDKLFWEVEGDRISEDVDKLDPGLKKRCEKEEVKKGNKKANRYIARAC